MKEKQGSYDGVKTYGYKKLCLNCLEYYDGSCPNCEEEGRE